MANWTPEERARQWVRAAEEHAAATSEPDFVAGDLELILAALLWNIPRGALRKFCQEDSIRELQELPEYQGLFNFDDD